MASKVAIGAFDVKDPKAYKIEGFYQCPFCQVLHTELPDFLQHVPDCQQAKEERERVCDSLPEQHEVSAIQNDSKSSVKGQRLLLEDDINLDSEEEEDTNGGGNVRHLSFDDDVIEVEGQVYNIKGILTNLFNGEGLKGQPHDVKNGKKGTKNPNGKSKGKFKCNECGNLFKYNHNLTRHKKTIHGNKRYVCNVCGENFVKQSLLQTHEKSHADTQDPINEGFDKTSNQKSGKTKFTCQLCGKMFKRQEQLSIHMQTHKTQKLLCKMCGKRFKKQQLLSAHVKLHMGQKLHICHVCGKAFKKISSKTAHLKEHTSATPHSCKVCKKKFARMNTLQHHLVHAHGNEKDNDDESGSIDENRNDIDVSKSVENVEKEEYSGDDWIIDEEHNDGAASDGSHIHNSIIKSIHADNDDDENDTDTSWYTTSIRNAKLSEQVYVCKTCGKETIHRGDMEEHIRSHAGYKPYLCELCEKYFGNKQHVQQHLIDLHVVEEKDVNSMFRKVYNTDMVFKPLSAKQDNKVCIKDSTGTEKKAIDNKNTSEGEVGVAKHVKLEETPTTDVVPIKKRKMNAAFTDTEKDGKTAFKDGSAKNGDSKVEEASNFDDKVQIRDNDDEEGDENDNTDSYSVSGHSDEEVDDTKKKNVSRSHGEDEKHRINTALKSMQAKSALTASAPALVQDLGSGSDIESLENEGSADNYRALQIDLSGSQENLKKGDAADKPYTCPVCGKSFSKKQYLSAHAVSHSDVKPFMCIICSKSFSRKPSLRTHLMNVHHLIGPQLADAMESCQLKAAPLPSMNKLDSSSDSSKDNETPLDFSISSKTEDMDAPLDFSSSGKTRDSDLPLDFSMKSKVEPGIQATQTKSDFENADSLDNSLDSLDLNAKAEALMNAVTLQCNVCLKTFSTKGNLRVHVNIHLNARQYACEVCDKRFNQKSYIKLHMQKVHNILVAPTRRSKKPSDKKPSTSSSGIDAQALTMDDDTTPEGQDQYSNESQAGNQQSLEDLY